MQIRSNQITVASLQVAYGQRPSLLIATQQDVRAASAEVVTISSAARQAQAAEQSLIVGMGTDDAEAVIVKYQMPDWLASYGFPVANRLGLGARESVAQGSSAERKEYTDAINGHYQAVMTANGISNAEQHYQQTIVDHQRSDELRLQFQQRIQGDSHLLELMAKLGKPQPA